MKLKLCPFCGKEAEITYEDKRDWGNSTCHCSNEKCQMSNYHYTVKAWNTRKEVRELNKDKKDAKIVCLCGSSRFCEQIAIKKWELEKQGIIAIGLHLLPSSYMPVTHHGAEFEGVAKILDELHFKKIDLADEILIINVGGYIGN